MNIKEEPLIVKDVTLMSPGKWNGWNYEPEELKKAFVSTDWNDVVNTSVFLGHPERPNNAAADWAGRIKNPHQLEDGTIKGDIELWDPNIIYKLKVAKAGFGVSPRIVGLDDNFENEKTMSVQNFFFNSWGIVPKPAQDNAYLNLVKEINFNGIVKQLSKKELTKVTAMEEKRNKMGLSPSQFYAAPRDPPSSSALPIFDAAHVRNAMARFNQTKFKSPSEKAKARNKIISAAKKFKIDISNFKEMGLTKEERELLENLQSTDVLEKKMKGGKKQMSEEENKTEETAEAKEEETSSDDKPVEKDEEKKEELSDEQVLSIMNEDLDGFNEYAKEVRVSNPSISLKELAAKFKVQKERMNFVENLSDAEATVLLKKLLSKIGVNELSTKKEQPASNELANKIASLEKSIKELSKKEKIPAPKAVKNVTQDSKQPQLFGKAPSEGVMELAQMFGIR